MTKIEWTKRPGTKGESWNFLAGCTKVSEGCINCWALPMSWRLQNNPKRPDRYEGVVEKVDKGHGVLAEYFKYKDYTRWSGRVNLDYDALEIPYRWKKPRTVFVQSMGDLFHREVPFEFIDRVFHVMAELDRHTFLVLTKRPERIRNLWGAMPWNPNIWLGVTAENQEQADKRIPLLLQTPAAVRWVSVEPMLGAVSIPLGYLEEGFYLGHGLDWVVIGAESGPNRRPFSNIDAMRLAFQCDDARVPVFCKQTIVNGQVSKNPDEWPVELQRREWPK